MDSIEKYALFSGHSYDKNDQGAAHSANVTMITGTAMSDSTDGVVSVDFGGNTISADDEQAVDVSTTCAVKEGDTVQVSVVGADGTAKSLLVTGVIAGGDRIAKEVDGASTAASEAKQSASDAQNAADTAQNAADTAKANAAAAQSTADKAVTNAAAAQSTADTANSTANTTKTYFYNDGSGSHVVSKNSTSAGTRADVKTDGMHIVDQDDGKDLASFTSSGAAIGKDSEIHTKYSTDGIDFYEKNKSYPFTRIYPVSIEKEKYSAASISSAPSDITDSSVMDDGLWHSTGAVSTSAVDGTSADNNGWARAVLSANTVQSNSSKSASVEVFASNNNPNKGSGGVGGVDNYINMTAEEVYINNIPIHPVGSIYISVNSTSPASLFGGSWEQLENLYSDPDYSNAVKNGANVENPTITITQDCLAVLREYNTGPDSQDIRLLVNGKQITDAFAPGINLNGKWYVYFGLNIALPLKKGDVITTEGGSNQRIKVKLLEVPYKTINYRWKRIS